MAYKPCGHPSSLIASSTSRDGFPSSPSGIVSAISLVDSANISSWTAKLFSSVSGSSFASRFSNDDRPLISPPLSHSQPLSSVPVLLSLTTHQGVFSTPLRPRFTRLGASPTASENMSTLDNTILHYHLISSTRTTRATRESPIQTRGGARMASVARAPLIVTTRSHNIQQESLHAARYYSGTKARFFA